MRLLLTMVAAVWLLAGGAYAAPSANDRAAIAAMETALRPVSAKAGDPGKTITARMAELKGSQGSARRAPPVPAAPK